MSPGREQDLRSAWLGPDEEVQLTVRESSSDRYHSWHPLPFVFAPNRFRTQGNHMFQRRPESAWWRRVEL